MAGKFRARIQEKHQIYIHNDLENAAFYFKQIIDKKIADGGDDMTIFDRMACTVMLAFTFEAQLNFMGFKLIDNWKEFQSTDKKIDQVFQKLGIAPAWEERPFSSLRTLKEIRDALAHGKPEEREIDIEVEAAVGELDGRRADMSQKWQNLCTVETVSRAYEDVDAVWKLMLEKSGMNVWQTLTKGERGISVLGPISPDGL
jgi:hypothetical protein